LFIGFTPNNWDYYFSKRDELRKDKKMVGSVKSWEGEESMGAIETMESRE
jgi:hypothetical protein